MVAWTGLSSMWPRTVARFSDYEIEGANKELIKHSPAIIHSLVNTSGQDAIVTINLEEIIFVNLYSRRLKLL